MKITKAQIWFTDFVIGILIFLFVLISYYTYTTNILKQDTSAMDQLVTDIQTVSTSLTTEGFPSNWNANTVTRIGFTDNSNRIDNTKFGEFNEINYNKSKKLLGTIYDYFLFFVNESGDVQNIEGYCGTGQAEVNITYDISAAYYYKAAGRDQFLKTLMRDNFNADLYTKDGTGEPGDVITGNLCDLTNNINNYDVVVIEAPEMPSGNACGKFKPFKDATEPWVLAGGLLMISGELVSGQKKRFTDVDFKKEQGLSSPQERATVVQEDEFLDFNLADGLTFDQGFTTKGSGAINFKDIARFNESDIEFEDILNNKIAVARWEYGTGKVFFFSDFNAQYFNGNFQEILESSTQKWIGAACLPIGINNIKRDNLVKVERLLIYNSDPVKMVLYLWE